MESIGYGSNGIWNHWDMESMEYGINGIWNQWDMEVEAMGK